MMQVWNARCVPSPSKDTSFGRELLKKDPSTPGSLGIAISEAIEETLSDKSAKTRYSLGSVLNFVLLHQTIIGLEAKKQLNLIGEKKPDIIVGCVGGGSNFAGLSFPFLFDKINGQDIEVIAVEPTACPTLTRGEFAYDYGDTAGLTPLLAMYTLGHNFIPEPIHAGGLRYHGMAPLVSAGVKSGLIKPVAYDQIKCYQSALIWARTEGSIPAPETSHAIACVIDEALKAKKEKKSKVILFNYSGHGLLDLTGYDKFLQGKLKRYHLEKAKLETSLKAIKNFPKPKI
jgi:tryptophan synthase beta chain